MKIGIFAVIIIYYLVLGLFYTTMSTTFSGSVLTENISGITTEYQAGGAGVFDTIGSMFLFVTFGLGLPLDTPVWFQILFSAWSIFLVMVTILIIYQAVRGS
jgi:hypothetical protein